MREACETLAAARSATRTNRLGRGSDGEHNGGSNTASIAMDRLASDKSAWRRDKTEFSVWVAGDQWRESIRGDSL
ncbi:hypothetical protein QYF36_017760 [Acer negundo]|nr:hypothetical protein QYF36_017760 [Acer negundo]